MPTLNLVTLGCSKNTVDSEYLLGALVNDYDIIHDKAVAADVVMINTCGFINDAKEQSIDTILDFVSEKKKGKIKQLVVFGCLAKRYREELTKEIPEVDAWYGVDDHDAMVALLTQHHPVRKTEDHKRFLTTPKHYAYLKIAEGCNRACAFCIIPAIRGPFRSVGKESLLRETVQLRETGVQELILIAQDLAYYGKENHLQNELIELIRAILFNHPSLPWIRLHYLYPDMISQDLLTLMAREEQICKYLDIPFQHCTDNMLQLMKRGYGEKEVRQVINMARNTLPDIAIRTTFLVGHPGETQEDFDALCCFVEEMQFDRLGVFTYSHEENTFAGIHYQDTITEEVKQERLEVIMQIQESISLKKNKKKLGEKIQVLVDRAEGNFFIGRSQFDSPEVDNEIVIASKETLNIGHFYQVEITQAEAHDLYARVIASQ